MRGCCWLKAGSKWLAYSARRLSLHLPIQARRPKPVSSNPAASDEHRQLSQIRGTSAYCICTSANLDILALYNQQHSVCSMKWICWRNAPASDSTVVPRFQDPTTMSSASGKCAATQRGQIAARRHEAVRVRR